MDDLTNLIEELADNILDDGYPPHMGIQYRDLFDCIETIVGRKPIWIIRGIVPDFYPCIDPDAIGLIHTKAPMWDMDVATDWPEVMRHNLRPRQNVFIDHFSADEALLEQVLADTTAGTPEHEAHWLDYPVCCVEAFHRRHRAYAGYIRDAYLTASHGDPATIETLIKEDTAVKIDHRAVESARNGFLAPVCSFAYCDHCNSDQTAPGPTLNRRRTEFFADIAPDTLSHLQDCNEKTVLDGYTWEAYAREFDGTVRWSVVHSLFVTTTSV